MAKKEEQTDKSRWWLVTYVAEVDSVELRYLLVLEFDVPVAKKTVSLYAQKEQKDVFRDLKAVPETPDEPCQQGGEHWETNWMDATGQPVTMCLRIHSMLPIYEGLAEGLSIVGVPVDKHIA